ncbi:MAG TPA: ATP-dependent helicase, partial [Spirochaetales bacterium]|nr:ATP-dependent helicase [Spirochaetales bacterium]
MKGGGTELDLLLHLPISRVKQAGGELLAEAIKRMRNREVLIREGFDGEYGKIKVFTREEGAAMGSQCMLFDQTGDRAPAQSLGVLPPGLSPSGAEPVLPQAPGAQATGSQATGDRQQRDVLINFDFNEFRRRYRAFKGQLENNENSNRERKKVDFKELNPEQKRAVEHCSGPALVIAGPGAGKTHTLTLRIAHLIMNRNVNPENILAVTFTNKAAGEMSNRLELIFKKNQPLLKGIDISTFHAFGFSMLKENSKSIGREKDFSILDEEDKQRILKKVKELNTGSSGKISELSSAVTNIKQGLTGLEQIEDSRLKDLFLEYSHALKEENAVDLDDLIYLPVQALRENPPLLEQYRRRIDYLLIDEFQDINFAQYQLIRMLMPGAGANIYAIGDPNQAIYGFRGADVSLMDHFIRDYPQTVRYRLNTSYRCSDYILKASSRVIDNQVIDKSLKMPVLKALNRGVKITITGNSSEKSEAEYIARSIEKMIGGLRFFSIDSQITQGMEYKEISSLSDFAVLVRISRQMEPLEKAFRDHSIPYQRVGELPFFKEKPVKSILDLLKMLQNSRNRLLKEELASRYKLKEEEIGECRALIDGQLPVTIILNKIIDTWFIEDKLQNKDKLIELIELAKSFSVNLQEFIKFIALGGELAGCKTGAEKVSLLTLHAAKGLEFKCVFLAGCEQGLLPYALFKSNRPDPDEERRLFYVGMTRAGSFLFLTHARRRFIFNHLYQLEKSPFLAAIEKELAEFIDVEHKKNK